MGWVKRLRAPRATMPLVDRGFGGAEKATSGGRRLGSCSFPAKLQGRALKVSDAHTQTKQRTKRPPANDAGGGQVALQCMTQRVHCSSVCLADSQMHRGRSIAMHRAEGMHGCVALHDARTSTQAHKHPRTPSCQCLSLHLGTTAASLPPRARDPDLVYLLSSNLQLLNRDNSEVCVLFYDKQQLMGPPPKHNQGFKTLPPPVPIYFFSPGQGRQPQEGLSATRAKASAPLCARARWRCSTQGARPEPLCQV